MEFSVLGPLAVRGARGRKVAVQGTRRCELLAILLLHANEHLSAERLAEELWPDGQPKSARNALQVHISYLRKVLGEQTAIATGTASYCLRVDPDRIDARRFERLLAEGRKQLAARALETASESLRDALSLWRGPALADFRDAPFAQAEIARLEELRLAALEDRIDADLALGRARGARRRARVAGGGASLARAPAGPVDARPLPGRPAGRCARRVPASPPRARRRARDRALGRAEGPPGRDLAPRSLARPGGRGRPRLDAHPGRAPDRDDPRRSFHAVASA